MSNATTSYRLGASLALATALFLLWAIGALGIVGAGGPPDLMYVAVLVVGVVGAALARLRARGMARALAVTAAATLLVAVVALAAGLQDTEGASVVEILALSGMYAALFGASAWLFRRAADQGERARTPSSP